MPAIGALAVVLLAVAALLAAYGALALGKMLAQFLPKSIGVGPISIHPRGWVEDLISSAMAGMEAVMAPYVRPVVGFIMRPVSALLNFLHGMTTFVSVAATQLEWIVTAAIPQAIGAIRGWVWARLAAVEAWAVGRIVAAEAYALRLAYSARSYALALYHDATRYAVALVAGLRHDVDQLLHVERAARAAAVASAETYAVSLVRAARSDLGAALHTVEAEVKAIVSTTIPDVAKAVAAGVTEAEAYASHAAAAAVGTLTTDVATAVAGAATGLIDDVGKLAGVIGTDLPDIRALVDAIPHSLPLTIAGTSALSLALSRVAIKYMEQCGVPNCRNLSKVGRDLADLFGAVEGGAFLGLLAYMVGDPTGAADEARTVLGPMAEGLGTAARDLLGV